MVSLCVYLVVFLLSAELLNSYHKNNKIFVFVGLFIPIIFAAGRMYVGTDFLSYVYIFDTYTETTWSTFLKDPLSKNPLFFIICKISYLVGGRVLTFGVIAAIIIIITYKTLKLQYPDIPMGTSMAVFLFSSFAFSLNVCREYIAVVIVFWSLQYIFNDKLFKFIACIVIAALFHKTVVVSLVMWFLWDHRNHCAINGKKRFIIILATFFAVFHYRQITVFITSHISFLRGYASFINPAIRGTNNRDFYLALLELVVILLFSKNLKAKDYRGDFMITMMCVSVLIGITGFTHPHIKRIAYYFSTPALVVLFGYMPLCVREKQKGLMSGFIVFYMILKFTLAAYILGQGHLIPYTFDLVTDVLSTL